MSHLPFTKSTCRPAFVRSRTTPVPGVPHGRPPRRSRVFAAAILLVAASPPLALGQTADSEMAMRWWNSLNGPQMVAALYGDSATAAQEMAAKMPYANLDTATKMRANDAAKEIYGGGRFSGVGEWWETLDCRQMRIAAGDGNTADSSSPYCAHYPGSGLAKILGHDARTHVDRVGVALLGRANPGAFVPADVAMARRWWNSLNGPQMVAALYGDSATDAQAMGAKNMYWNVSHATRQRINEIAAELYGHGGFASVGAWWETLDCRQMRIAAGDGNMAHSSSPYCAHYPGSGIAKLLADTAKAHVDMVGMAFLRRNDPGVFPTPHNATAMRWWNSLNGPQMVAALFGDSATAAQETAAKKMYAGLRDGMRYRVNNVAAELYGGGDYPSVGTWWETLDCRLMRVAAGDGNTVDPMSPYCAHYPGSGLAKILSAMATAHVDMVGIALLGRLTAGAYPVTYRLPLFPSASDMDMRQGLARIVNRGNRSVDVRLMATDDAGMTRGPVMLSIGPRAVAHFDSADLEHGNAMKGLSAGVGEGTGNWRLELTSTLPLRALSYIRNADGLLTSAHEVAPQSMYTHVVVFMNPADDMTQASWLRIANAGSMTAHVRIEGMDDTGGSAPGSAVELYVPAHGVRMVSADDLEHGATGLMGALGHGEGRWRLEVTSNQGLQVTSLLESPSGHLTNVSAGPSH